MTDSKKKKKNGSAVAVDEKTGQNPEVAAASTDDTVIDEPTLSVEEALEAAVESPDEAASFYAVSPFIPGPPESSFDGAWLAYLQPDEHNAPGLWITPTDGGEARQIDVPFIPVEDVDPDSGRAIRGPQWSPDGTSLALTGMHPEGDRTAVWIVPTGLGHDLVAAPGAVALDDDVEGEIESTDASVPETDAVEASAAPQEEDAEAMAAPAMEDAVETELVVVDGEELDAETTDVMANVPEEPATPVAADEAPATVAKPPRMLVDHAGADHSPRWSPDGEIIAMSSTIDGRDVITLAPSQSDDASALEFLTWSSSNDREPVWSRDGKFLAFTRQRLDGPEHADIYCFSLENGELRNLTSEKGSAIRHSLEWVPGRNLIAYVTRENEWLSISVINADNKAGWTVTRESGDKTEPRFAQGEARLVYVRTEGFTTVMCERSLHASSAVALDPGEGVVRYPRWLNEKRVVYGFSAPQRPFGFLVQDNIADTERTPVAVPGMPSVLGQNVIQPQPFEFEVGPEEMFSGMLYKTHGVAGKVPALVYMPDGPATTRRGEFQIEEQALASTALTVLTPVIHGASGFGVSIENDLRDFAATELESSDLAEVGRALGRDESIDASKLALIGHGYGGTLALVTAGSRPGAYAAVVAIDPVTDWSIELANCDVPWRNWVTDRFGMPLADADHYALRTPATFSAVIDAPLMLVRTENAPEHRKIQMDLFVQDLDEIGVSYEMIDAPEEMLAATLRDVSMRLTRKFLGGAEQADVVGDLRADDLE